MARSRDDPVESVFDRPGLDLGERRFQLACLAAAMRGPEPQEDEHAARRATVEYGKREVTACGFEGGQDRAGDRIEPEAGDDRLAEPSFESAHDASISPSTGVAIRWSRG